MESLSQYVTICMDALFLEDDLFRNVRRMSLGRAAALVLLVGLVVGIAGFVGQTVKYSSEPTFQQIERIWKEPMREQQKNAPWFSEMPASARREWDGMYDTVWAIVGRVFTIVSPAPTQAFVGIFAGIVWKVVVWGVVGLVLFLSARILGGTGSLSETLVAVSLGVVPHVLEIVKILPYVVTGGILVWSCVIIAKAMMNAHSLTRMKAVLALILPVLALIVLFVLLAVVT